MKLEYSDTEEYWGNVFASQILYNPYQELPYAKIEKAIKWLCESNRRVIDFGCGDGRMLSRCLDYNVEYICGIDISKQAVNLARRVMESYYLDKRSKFICGGVEKLSEVEEAGYGGAVLSNIIDNVLPADTDKILEEIYRILVPGARVIIKLNPYYNPVKLEDNNNYIKIRENLYKEDSGLYLYNISNEKFKSLIDGYFNIVKKDIIEFEEYDMINRIFYLHKLKG